MILHMSVHSHMVAARIWNEDDFLAISQQKRIFFMCQNVNFSTFRFKIAILSGRSRSIFSRFRFRK